MNKEIVKIQRVTSQVGQIQLKSLIQAHVVKSLSFLFIPLPGQSSNCLHVKSSEYSVIFSVLDINKQEKTGSSKGATIVEEWDKYLSMFWQLVPPSEEDTPEANSDHQVKTPTGEEEQVSNTFAV